MLIDTHCHLFKEYYENIEEVINDMESNIIIVSGTNIKTNKEVIDLCEKYNNVYGTLGIHPSEYESFNEENLTFIEKNINHSKIIGVGEIGLDYYWETKNKDKQIELFEKQLDLAKKYDKTVVVHSRSALEDTYNILKQGKYSNLKIILHCYSYDLNMAKKFTNLGIMLGISGIITFKKSKVLQEVVKEIDLKHLVIETDSPYLSPVPHRGKQNQPIYIKEIAKKISELKEMEVEKVYKITTSNALRQFDIKLDL